MNEIKHIFFDLDHTLWDFEKNSALAFEKIFQELNFEIDTQQFMDIYNPINVAYWKLYERNEIDQEALRVNRLKDAFEAIDFEITLEEINAISNLFIDYLTSNNHLIEGTIETLDYLKEYYELHIITNGFSFVQEVKLQKSNLDKYFVTITNSELAGHKKPHENIFQYALLLANASKKQSIMIGDSMEADVLGAMNFGMKAVYFNPSNEQVSHNEIIHIQKLTQLKKHIIMKKILVIFIVLFSITSFSQKQIILISTKFEFQREPNSYNINNMLKAILTSNNYQVYFEDEVLPLDIAQNKCKALKGVLVDKSNVFLTKVKLQIKDCQNNLLFETAEVKSKEKDIQTAFVELIKLLSPELKKYKPVVIAAKPVVAKTKPDVVEKKEVVENSSEVAKTTFSGCKIQEFSNGFNVVTSSPLQTLFIQKTSHPNIYLAHKYSVTGIFTKYESKGVFEYYFEGKLMTEEYLF